MKLRLSVFDFDGVLIDSNRAKYQAWFEIYATRPVHEQEALRTVLATKREASRYDILAAITEAFGLAMAERERYVQEMAARYQDEIRAKLLVVYDATIEPALTMLATSCELVISSATPTTGLRQTVEALRLTPWFQQVLGSPPDKIERLRGLMEERGLTPQEVLVVGDGESDRASALAHGCHFVGIPNEFNHWTEADGIDLLSSVHALPTFLQERGLT